MGIWGWRGAFQRQKGLPPFFLGRRRCVIGKMETPLIYYQRLERAFQRQERPTLRIFKVGGGRFRDKRDLLPALFQVNGWGGCALDAKKEHSHPHYLRLDVGFRGKSDLPQNYLRRGGGLLETKGTSPAAEHHTGTKKGILVWLNAPPPLQIQCGVECPTL